MFASSLAVTMSVTALLKDQNDKIILNKFTVYTLSIGETRKWFVISRAAKLNSLFFFCRRRTPDASSGIHLSIRRGLNIYCHVLYSYMYVMYLELRGKERLTTYVIGSFMFFYLPLNVACFLLCDSSLHSSFIRKFPIIR